MDQNRVFKVIFLNQGEVFEIFARRVEQGSLFAFVEVEEIIFGERSQVVVDPSEERLKSEFRGVKRIFIPLHSVVRIDEVEKQGTPRVSASQQGKGNVASFPGPIYTPRGDSGDS